jgi:hypothetical protein
VRAHLEEDIDEEGDDEKDGADAGDGDDFGIKSVWGEGAVIIKGCIEGRGNSQAESTVNLLVLFDLGDYEVCRMCEMPRLYYASQIGGI